MDLLSVANKSSERLTLSSASRPKHSCPADSLEKRAIPRGRFRKAKPTVSQKSFPQSCNKTLNYEFTMQIMKDECFWNTVLQLPEKIFIYSDTFIDKLSRGKKVPCKYFPYRTYLLSKTDEEF